MNRLLALLLSVALLLPATGGALALLAGARTVVLCVGSVRVTVTLDADGAPVEQATSIDTDCLTAPALAGTARPHPQAHRITPVAIAAEQLPIFAISAPAQNLSRGPPLPV